MGQQSQFILVKHWNICYYAPIDKWNLNSWYVDEEGYAYDLQIQPFSTKIEAVEKQTLEMLEQ